MSKIAITAIASIVLSCIILLLKGKYDPVFDIIKVNSDKKALVVWYNDTDRGCYRTYKILFTYDQRRN